MKRFLTVLAIATLLSGCSMDTQTTSGQEYLSRYQYVPVHESTQPIQVDKNGVAVPVKSIDQSVREAAAVEPILKFPARIGLARIDSGALTIVPAEEAEGWDAMRQKLGSGFGDFVPVNPLVVSMVSQDSNYRSSVHNIVDSIRLGAARQHLDAVLIYEVLSKDSRHSNILSVANLTVVGGYILPSQLHDADGLGDGLLIDVIQGYPYGSISTVVKDKRISSSWGWGSDRGDDQDFADSVKAKAAQQLADEAYKMFIELRDKLPKDGPAK